MMNSLRNGMASNERIMHHWHERMKKNPAMMKKTMDDWVNQMKDNPELFKNMMVPMTSYSELREKMIQTMKNHDTALREQMIELMLEHKDFMNSIRHENPSSGH